MKKNEESLEHHFIKQKLSFGKPMICLSCTQDMGDEKGNIQITELVLHSEIHELDSHEFPAVCRFSICKNIEFLSLLRYVKHQIYYHTVVGRQIFAYIELLYGAKSKFLSASINCQDFIPDSIFTVRPQLSTSVKSKKSLKKEFDTIYNEFKEEKHLGEEGKVPNINSELLFCKND